MANYQAHVATGIVAGLVGALATASVVGWAWWPPSLPQLALLGLSLLAGLLGGMIPDLDHDHGTPLREMTSLLSTLVAAIVLAGWSGAHQELGGVIVLLPLHYVLHRILRRLPGLRSPRGVGALARRLLVASVCVVPWYVWSGGQQWTPIRYWGLVCGLVLVVHGAVLLFKEVTVHRGLFHSVPAVLLYGELVFVLLSCTTGLAWSGRWIVAGAGWAGGLSHLLLDELTAVDFEGRRWKNRRSLGTALNFWEPNAPAWSLALYVLALVGGLALFVLR